MKQPAIGKLRYSSALLIARVFKVLAVLTLLGGAITLGGGLAEMDDTPDLYEDSRAVFASIVIATTIVSAAVLAFFGYVLEILVDIFEQAWNTRFAAEEKA